MDFIMNTLNKVIIIATAPKHTPALAALVCACFAKSCASAQDVSLAFESAGRSFTWEDIHGTYKYGPVFRGSDTYLLAFNGYVNQWKRSGHLAPLFALDAFKPFSIGQEHGEQMYSDEFADIEALCKFFNTNVVPKDHDAIRVEGDLLIAWENKKAA